MPRAIMSGLTPSPLSERTSTKTGNRNTAQNASATARRLMRPPMWRYQQSAAVSTITATGILAIVRAA